MTERERERERKAEREEEGEAGSMWGSIPGPWDHDPSRRQMPKQLNYPGTLFLIALIYILHGLLKESSQ